MNGGGFGAKGSVLVKVVEGLFIVYGGEVDGFYIVNGCCFAYGLLCGEIWTILPDFLLVFYTLYLVFIFK